MKVLTVSGKGPPPPISLNSVCRVTVTCWGAVPTFATEQTKLWRLFQYSGGVARSVGGFFPDPRSPRGGSGRPMRESLSRSNRWQPWRRRPPNAQAGGPGRARLKEQALSWLDLQLRCRRVDDSNVRRWTSRKPCSYSNDRRAGVPMVPRQYRHRSRKSSPQNGLDSARRPVRRLRHFNVLAETLNFSRAAERLHIAQPSSCCAPRGMPLPGRAGGCGSALRHSPTAAETGVGIPRPVSWGGARAVGGDLHAHHAHAQQGGPGHRDRPHAAARDACGHLTHAAQRPLRRRVAGGPPLAATRQPGTARDGTGALRHVFGRRGCRTCMASAMAACQEAGFVPQEATQISTVVALVGIGLGVALVPQVMQGYLEPRVGYQVIDELQGGNRATAVASAWQPAPRVPPSRVFSQSTSATCPNRGSMFRTRTVIPLRSRWPCNWPPLTFLLNAGVFGRRIFFPICAPA